MRWGWDGSDSVGPGLLRESTAGKEDLPIAEQVHLSGECCSDWLFGSDLNVLATFGEDDGGNLRFQQQILSGMF